MRRMMIREKEKGVKKEKFKEKAYYLSKEKGLYHL